MKSNLKIGNLEISDSLYSTNFYQTFRNANKRAFKGKTDRTLAFFKNAKNFWKVNFFEEINIRNFEHDIFHKYTVLRSEN